MKGDMLMGKIYEIYGADPVYMTQALMAAANIAEKIPSGASIALKPNLVLAAKPERGATTHAGVLEGCIRYLRDHGFKDVSIIEGSWVGDATPRAFKVCGYDRIGKDYGVPLVDLKQDETRTVQTEIGPMEVCRRALETDYLINLPVLKGHCQTVMTCALKNLKGCISDREKRRFHSLGLHRPIAALAAVLRPGLTIVDSICGDLSFEEGGNPVTTNRMLLGEDPVGLDAYGCALMGIDPGRVPYIRLAQELGVGSAQIGQGDVIALNNPADAPVYPAATAAVSALTRNVTQKSACSACYGNLVHALYRLDRELGRPFKKPVIIGQDFKKSPPRGEIGIGRCCACAAVHVPGCPPTADAILKTLAENS